MPILSTESLSIQHTATSSILKFPDITIERGDKILLLGASGSGKTSLLSAMAGLLTPKTGHVLMDGQDLYSMNAKQRDSLRGKIFGFIFQTLHLLPSLTIKQNILLAADMANITPQENRLKNLLSSLDLEDKANSKPSELSQGQQQRAAMARAIFNCPSLIIADEPTSSLDDCNAERVIDLLEQQAKIEGSALLVATHDQRIKNRFSKIIDLSLQSSREVA